MAQCAGSVCNCAGADGEGVPSASGMAQCAGSVCNCAGADGEGVPSASGKEEGRPWRRPKSDTEASKQTTASPKDDRAIHKRTTNNLEGR